MEKMYYLSLVLFFTLTHQERFASPFLPLPRRLRGHDLKFKWEIVKGANGLDNIV